jgi:hypothetical protein
MNVSLQFSTILCNAASSNDPQVFIMLIERGANIVPPKNVGIYIMYIYIYTCIYMYSGYVLNVYVYDTKVP